MADNKINVGGRLHSIATGNVLAGANEILDDSKNKKQSDINAETDAALEDRYTKEQTYSKPELNNLITTPNQQYVSVTANSQTTTVTDVLPATGAANTVYRVGNWDGSQFDASVYSEYAWNGNQYVHLSTKTKIGEVFDISAYHATGGTLAKYADLAAALDSNNGGGVPQSLQSGGMSIKFVQSSDNKYVQCRLMADEFTTDTTQWAIADGGVYVENPEFVKVVLDNESKILEAVRADGTKLLPAGVEINKKIDLEGNETTIIENPEFVEVKLDNAGKILWAIKKDGGIYYGAGCPQQVKDYIEEKIAELSLDEYEDIVVFLADLEKGDETLRDLLDKKVDGEYVENPEFVEVITDSEDKVLEGIQEDGTKIIGGDLNVGGSANINGDIRVLGNMEVSGVSYKVIENPEYLAAWVDAEDKIIFGLKADGKTYVGDADFLNDIDDIKAFLQNITDKDIDWDALSSIAAVENPEFIEVKTDKEGKILAGRTPDGAAFENVGFFTLKVSIDGHTIKNIEDPEGRNEITTDAEGKIISYRKDDCTLVENVGIETPNVNTENISAKEVNIEGGHATLDNLELTEQGMSDFQQALKESGFNPGGTGDWSDYYSADGSKPLCLSIPRCAKVNILDDYDLTALSKKGLPGANIGVNCERVVQIEFSDMQGNYFRKWARMSGQGASSMSLPKKSIAIDFYESQQDAIDDEEGFGVKFGNWVTQNSYHMKAFYTDFFKGVAIVGYQLADQIQRSRLSFEDRPWKKALLSQYNYQDGVYNDSEYDDLNLQFDNGARCFPDAFPCIVYQKGIFYGIFSFALKKHRDNYHQSKSNPKHVHIDGAFYDRKDSQGHTTHHSIWMGILDWTVFEVRNPKNLVYATAHIDFDGETQTYKYDADLSQDEIAGNSDGSTEYDVWEQSPENPYTVGQIVEHTIDGNKHRFLNTIEGNTKEPAIVYDASKDKTYNSDKEPDFKNKSKCGWLNVTNTIKVKEAIIALSKHIPNCKSAETLEEKRQIMDTYFDKDNLIDWCNHTNFIYNVDSTQNNTQWVTYDGVKWFACIYDLDISFGTDSSIGTTVAAPNSYNIAGGDGYYPGAQIWTCYADDVKARYQYLKDEGILTYDNVAKMLQDWIDRIGVKNYEQEYSKWDEAPCNRSNNGTYTKYPQTGGHYDNLYRLLTWLKVRSQNVDTFMGVQ